MVNKVQKGELKHLFIIDDDDLLNSLLENIIIDLRPDLTISTFTSGWKALEYLSRATESFPEFILLDINMPEMDGFNFWKLTNRNSCKWIQE